MIYCCLVFFNYSFHILFSLIESARTRGFYCTTTIVNLSINSEVIVSLSIFFDRKWAFLKSAIKCGPDRD